MLIFLHVPKTAGTTFNDILRRQYGKRNIVVVDYLGKSILNPIEDMSDKEKLKIKCITGHAPYGIHEQLPQKATYITFLRKPVDRFISAYYHALRMPGTSVHSTGISLDEFIESELSVNYKNLHVRLISGYGTRPLPDDALQIAKKNLKDHFAVVGIVESFDESILIMKKVLGWRHHVCSWKRMVGKNRKKKEEHPRDLIKRIEDANRLDIELYSFAQDLFREEKRRYNGDLEGDVRQFHIVNNLYQAPYRILYPIEQKVGIRRFYLKIKDRIS